MEKEWEKDYRDAPLKYSRLGADELILFDPEAAARYAQQGVLFEGEPLGGRQPCSLYRAESNGQLTLVTAGAEPFHSEVLDAWLLPIEREGLHLLALARDSLGHDLIPPLAEAMAAERDAAQRRAEEAEAAWEAERLRAEREQARAEREQARAEREQARAEREQARAEAAEAAQTALLEELRRLRQRLGDGEDR